MEKTDEILASGIQKISEALQNAAAEYGAATVDLALMAIRLKATGDMLFHLSVVTIFLMFTIITTPKVFHAMKTESAKAFIDRNDSVLIGLPLIYIVITTFLAIGAAKNFGALLYLPKWAAAFGYPEILIATNALRAAGIL